MRLFLGRGPILPLRASGAGLRRLLQRDRAQPPAGSGAANADTQLSGSQSPTDLSSVFSRSQPRLSTLCDFRRITLITRTTVRRLHSLYVRRPAGEMLLREKPPVQHQIVFTTVADQLGLQYRHCPVSRADSLAYLSARSAR